jgi:hypothetical protein
MFQVFENNIPCEYPNHNVRKTWNNSKFKTFEEALKYADDWLGILSPLASLKDMIKLNVPYDYSGYGDKIEIREL